MRRLAIPGVSLIVLFMASVIALRFGPVTRGRREAPGRTNAGGGAAQPVKSISSFENGNPFTNSAVVPFHATDGERALRIRRGYAAMQAAQNWEGYDLLKVDTYTESAEPLPVTIEIQDAGTRDYWTRVNRQAIVSPGQGVLILPLRQLYVGEKSRPGRKLLLGAITRLVFSIGNSPAAALYLDNLRLERDLSAANVFFEGLHAFDFGPAASPVLDGFTAVTPDTQYDPGHGYGLKDARIRCAVDALQPDPLYQDFLCIEAGGLAVDVPNGKYRVFVNINSPGGFWGEVQAFRERSIKAQGRTVVSETMNFESFSMKYFQFWDRDDLPSENTFEKYSRAHFAEKMFDVEVSNGQLDLEFNGDGRACSVSAVIIYPREKAAEGRRFLAWVEDKRRFYFEQSFQRVLHTAAGEPLAPTAVDAERGYVLFARDYMQDLYYNDRPTREDVAGPLFAEAFAGQEEPVTLAVIPLRDIGESTVAVTALGGPQGAIPAQAIEIGYVSHRITRTTLDGSIFTIAPRLVIPRSSAPTARGLARQFWLNVRTPLTAKPGLYTGWVTFAPSNGAPASVPFSFLVRKGALAEVDIPAGPFGGQIGIPWLRQDPATTDFARTMTERSLRALRRKGFTMMSGIPRVVYRGFAHGLPLLDFEDADLQMRAVKELGFLGVSSYGAGLNGVDPYHQQKEAMRAAAFRDYSAFVGAIYGEIQRHARQNGWVDVYWNLADEPVGEELTRSIENAKAYRAAMPEGPPFFTGAASLYPRDSSGLYLKLAETLHIAALNLHDEAGVKRLRARGGQWAFYNNASRWTFGEYLYKAASEFGVRYRLAWHWNAAAGDPYYALDCREDDYAWASATPDGQLAPSLSFYRIAAGLNDYRYLATLARLAKQKPGTREAKAAERLIETRMATFHLGDTARSFGPRDWSSFRQQVGRAIEALQ